MATRLYSTTTAAPISPAPASGWEVTAPMVRRLATITAGSADDSTSPPAPSGSGVANEDTIAYQLVYGPVAAQTISGNVKGQFGARETNAASDARAQCTIRVIAPDASTVRGTLLAMDTGALSSEFLVDGSARENRKVPRGGSTALTSVAATAGDYVVIEIGFRNHGTNTGQVRPRMGGSTSTTDMPEDETTNVGDGTGYRGWIEFSNTITPYDEAPAGNAAGTGTANQPAASVGVNAGNATGTGAAYDATVSLLTPPRTVLINGSDRTSVIRHDSYSFVECANRGEVGIGGFMVDDSANTLDIPALKSVTFEEPAASDKRVFTGYTHTRATQRGPNKVAGQREWDVETVDLNTLADDFILSGAGAQRGSETDYARVVWLLTTALNTTGGVSSGVVPNSNTVTMDAADYRGRKARDVLNECSEAAGKNWFIYRYTSGPLLYYDLATGSSLSSSAKISDVAADVITAQIEALESTTGWAAGASTTLSAVATNPDGYSGTSLQMAVAAQAADGSMADKTVSLDLSDAQEIGVWLRSSSVTNLNHIDLYFYSGVGVSNYAGFFHSPSGTNTWEEYTFDRTAPDDTGGSIDWSDITRVQWWLNVTGGAFTGNVIVRDLRVGDVSGVVWASIAPVTVTKNPDRIYSKVHLTYNEGVVTASNATTATNYRTREVHVLDSSITSSTLAQAKADELVANAASEITDVSDVTLFMPAANVNDIRAGQRVEMKLTRHGISSYTWFRCIRRSVKPATDVEYLVTLSFASDVLASANGGRGSDDVWWHKSNATDDGATVIVDEGGITVTDGAFTLTDSGGSTVMTGGGFAGTWLDYLQSGIYNGGWRAAPPTPASAITTAGGGNEVPSWEFVKASGTAINAEWTADPDAGSGAYILLDMAAGSAGDHSYLEQYVDITATKGRIMTLKARATFEIDTLGTGGSAVPYVSVQFYKNDMTTTTGSTTTEATTVSSLNTFTIQTATTDNAAVPDDAGFVRIRVGLSRSGAANGATCAIRIHEVLLQQDRNIIYVADAATPDNDPAVITQEDGLLRFAGAPEMRVETATFSLWTSPVMLVLSDSFSANQDNYDPETTFGSVAPIWELDNTAGASRNITGISIGQEEGTTRWIVNVSANNIVLVHDLTSTAANRFSLPGAANYTLTAGQGVMIYYSGASRWKVIDK